MKPDKERFLAAGTDADVSKPVRPDELNDVLEDLISQRPPDAVAPRAPQPDSTASGFDRAQALQFFSGSEQLLMEIAAVFLQYTPQVLTEMREAITTGDAKTLERAAHTLKGSLAMFGADKAKATAQQLESMGRTCELAGADAVFAVLQDELVQLSTALNDLIRTDGAQGTQDSTETACGEGRHL